MQDLNDMSSNTTIKPQNHADGKGEKTFSDNDKEKLLRTFSADSSGSIGEPTTVTTPDKGKKSTLFNIRLTSLKPKRLSDDDEEEEDEEHKVGNASGSKSENQHVKWNEDARDEPDGFEFVKHKTTKFGRGTSSTDFTSADDEAGDGNDDVSDEFSDPLTISNSKESSPKSDQEKQENSVHFSLGKPEPQNRSFIKEKLASPLRKKRGSASDTKSTEKSPLLGKLSGRASPVSSLDSSLLRPASNGEDDSHNTLPSSPIRSEASSEDDSPYMNTSEEADNVLSPSIPSDDGVGVCSKYSQLSEDGSSPSSPTKSAAAAGDEVEGKLEPESFTERDVFEHSLELGVAFTEFVDVDNFRASLGKKNPHTEDTFGGRSEEHLVILLKGGSRKPLKSYLRNSQWPAESDARRHMWENICTHLVKAGGHLYQEVLDELLPPETEDIGLPTFVDPENVPSYYLTPHGSRAAKMVVNVIARLSPEIVYCPMLLPMSTMFLHYMSPESCFNCMQALLSSACPQYFSQTKVKTEASKYVLRDLSKKYTKQAYSLMMRSAKSVESVFDSWMWWIFKDLPFQYLVRIIDSYLLEGYKVLYRIALAIVFLFAKESSQHGNRNSPVNNINAAITRFCKNMPHEPKKLIKVGFGIRGLTRKEIAKLHDKNEAYIKSLPVNDHVRRIVSSPSMSQFSVARSLQGQNMGQNPSTILSSEMLHTIWGWIPMRLTLKKPKLLFSSEDHGTAIRTLYIKTEHAPQTLLIIKSTSDEVFGAFCSVPWHTRHEKNVPHTSFFGTGETFVFTLQPEISKYAWTGMLSYPAERTADHFMAGDDHMLIVGSGNGEAIYLDTMMNRCTSRHCDTFDNEPLCSTTDFTCRVVEVFGFID